MEERILNIINQNTDSYSIEQLFDFLALKTVEEMKLLIRTLNEMEDTLKVYRTKKGNYTAFQNSHMKIGKLVTNKKGFGFVDIGGEIDVFIPPVFMNGAIHGDQVVVEITSDRGYQMEGRIVRVIERELKQIVGEYYIENGKGHLKLDDEKVKLNIEIDSNLSLGAMEGHKVLVRILDKIQGYTYKGQVIKVLGHKNDPGVDILSVVVKYNIEDEFSDEVYEEVEKIPDEVLPEEMFGRKDFRDEIIFTIDGDDTKDIDDAISIQKLENGNYQLGVHIADVSYYVKPNTALDDTAFSRGTSVYLADRVIPMLPHKLSNGICSLNPNVDRLAMSCIMEIDSKGNTVSSDIVESVIRSRKQMTYKNVNQILNGGAIPEGYEEYKDKILLMEELAQILRKNKEEKGYIDFEVDEAKIIVNEKGEAIDVIRRERDKGEMLIEDFMIAANEAVATTIYLLKLPFIYRVHGEPDEEKIAAFLKFVSVLGYQVKGSVKNITPKAMQNLLEQLKEAKEFHILSALMLRSMQKAIYDTTNIGHFGLASKNYTHFTSPIRRYPDTTVHRLLRTYLFQHHTGHDTLEFYANHLPMVAEHSSEKERSAIECEREVNDLKKAEYMEKHIGETFTGIVSGVTNFGLFIQLPNLVEGLIHVDELRDYFYTYDEMAMTLRGEKNKRGYRLGDEVVVVAVNASKETKKVDFVLEKDYESYKNRPKEDTKSEKKFSKKFDSKNKKH